MTRRPEFPTAHEMLSAVGIDAPLRLAHQHLSVISMSRCDRWQVRTQRPVNYTNLSPYEIVDLAEINGGTEREWTWIGQTSVSLRPIHNHVLHLPHSCLNACGRWDKVYCPVCESMRKDSHSCPLWDRKQDTLDLPRFSGIWTPSAIHRESLREGDKVNC